MKFQWSHIYFKFTESRVLQFGVQEIVDFCLVWRLKALCGGDCSNLPKESPSSAALSRDGCYRRREANAKQMKDVHLVFSKPHYQRQKQANASWKVACWYLDFPMIYPIPNPSHHHHGMMISIISTDEVGATWLLAPILALVSWMSSASFEWWWWRRERSGFLSLRF